MKKGSRFRLKALSFPFPDLREPGRTGFGRVRDILRRKLNPARVRGMRAGTPKDPEIEPHYDFSEGVRGKYVGRYAEGTNVVVLAPDVSKAFPDSDAVNSALRAIMDGHQESTPSTPR